MKIGKTMRAAVVAGAVFGLAACGDSAEDVTDETAEATEETTEAVEEATEEVAEAGEAASEEMTICDENGNRYASEEDAAAAGLEEAQYGATYCQYFEE